MPSFASIPLKLQITGLSFDGVALLAYLRRPSRSQSQSQQNGSAGGDNNNNTNTNTKNGEDTAAKQKVHFCFLNREDARAMVGRTGAAEDTHTDDTNTNINNHPKPDTTGTEPENGEQGAQEAQNLGTLLREIRVESEIGSQETEVEDEDRIDKEAGGGGTGGGKMKMKKKKQVLKNVGKVEKFVLEQVRRIFEEEVVWPSWWTVLV